MLTVIAYLADTCNGGDTVFPLLNAAANGLEKKGDDGMDLLVDINDACFNAGERRGNMTDSGVAFLPRRGNAVYFASWDVSDGSVFKPDAWHCSCPVGGRGGRQKVKFGAEACARSPSGDQRSISTNGDEEIEEQKWLVQYWVHEYNFNVFRDALASWPFLQHGESNVVLGHSYESDTTDVGVLSSSRNIHFNLAVGEGILWDEQGRGVGLATLPAKVTMNGRVKVKNHAGASEYHSGAIAINRSSEGSAAAPGGGGLSLALNSMTLTISREVAMEIFTLHEFVYIIFGGSSSAGSVSFVFVKGADNAQGRLLCDGSESCEALGLSRPVVGPPQSLVGGGGGGGGDTEHDSSAGDASELQVEFRNNNVDGIIVGGLRIYEGVLSAKLCQNGDFFGWL